MSGNEWINVTRGCFKFNSCIIISSMLNPHQNININISYNLTHTKSTKHAPAKKINKLQKPLIIPTSHCDVEIKLKNKHTDQHKGNVAGKNANEKKAHKKKVSNFVRNAITPELNDCRIKTEGPSADLQASKKELKTKQHSKSTQPGATKPSGGAISSKKSGSTKAVKSGRQGHVNSFLLINPRKTIEPIRRKGQHSFTKNDKVVSKLLNMSLLASDIGGSRPITSERQNSESHSRTFKQYLSSMDMRLLRTMQDDIPTFSNHRYQQQIVKSLMFAKGISLQMLTNKVIIIQRAWKKALSKVVVHKYGLLFRQATDKLNREGKSHQISSFAAESIVSQTYDLENMGAYDQAMAFQHPNADKSLSRDNSFQNMPLQWSEEGRRPHLDLARYQKLVSENVRDLGSLDCERRHFDPASLLDTFIQQSQYNKHWIQNEFQPSSSKPSQANSAEKQPEVPSSEVQQDEEDSLDQSHDYNRIKYASPQEEHQMLERRIQELENSKRQSRRERPHEDRWRMMDSNVVKGYLQCGLSNFGLHVDQKILKIEDKEEREDKSDQQADVFSDEAIGVRFQEANRSKIRAQQPAQAEPILAQLKEKELQGTVEFVIVSLINEFALDISSILKKSGPPPPPPRPAARTFGIPTGFAAVRNYLTQLIAFLHPREDYLNRIINNINKDIGPTSMEILSYLRPENDVDIESQSFQEEGLFVVPAELFQEFESELEQRQKQKQQEQNMRTKAYSNFWHRCIFQSFNQCLDYQRPYGLDGKPYDWVIHTKQFRQVEHRHLQTKLHSAQERLLELTLMVGGVIFEKPDGPFAQADFSDEEKHRINQERLSRILATELLDSEHSWTNYSDETAELLVELARMLESAILDEAAVELQRVRRRRKLLPDFPLPN